MKAYVSCRITGIREEAYGVVVTAKNGPTSLEFAVDSRWKRDLHIGMQVRGELEVADA